MKRTSISNREGRDKRNQDSPEVKTITSDELKRFLLEALFALRDKNYEAAQKAMSHYEGFDNVFFRAYPYLYYYKALIAYGLKDYDSAEHFFREYVAKAGADEIAFFHLGNVYYQKQQWDKALESYNSALDMRKAFPEALANIGIIARQLGDEDMAKAVARSQTIFDRIFVQNELCEDPLEFALAIPKELSVSQIPIFINSRDRLETLKLLLNWLKKAGQQRIYILDNDSTYPPLLGFYPRLDESEPLVQVLYLKKNLGHTALWDSKVLEILHIDTPYVYTDSDVVPSAECPLGVVGDLLEVLRKYPFLKKAGLALKTDDITYFDAEKTKEAEKRFYLHEIEPELYFGAVDTTFALYRNYRHYNLYVSARTTGNRTARHLPWYYDYENLPDDEKYYMEHANSSASLVQKIKEKDVLMEKDVHKRTDSKMKTFALICDPEMVTTILRHLPNDWQISCIIRDTEDMRDEERIDNIPVVNFLMFRKCYLRDIDGALVVMGAGLQRAAITNRLRYYGISQIGFPRTLRAIDISHEGIAWTEGKPYLSQVEIHLMDSCNLNCTGCSHFSNLFQRDTVYNLDQFSKDLSLFSRQVFVSTLFLLGGEPFANPQIKDYLRIARQNFPICEIILVTNGLLIPQQSDDVMEALRQEQIDVEISLYPPTAKMLDKIKDRMKNTGVKYRVRAERPAFMAFLGTSGTSDPYLSQRICCNAHCRYIRNGVLYKCPVDALSYKYREQFGVPLPPAEGIRLDSIDFERKLSLLDQPIQLCRYCTEKPRVFPWSVAVQPQKEDWFGIDE